MSRRAMMVAGRWCCVALASSILAFLFASLALHTWRSRGSSRPCGSAAALGARDSLGPGVLHKAGACTASAECGR